MHRTTLDRSVRRHHGLRVAVLFGAVLIGTIWMVASPAPGGSQPAERETRRAEVGFLSWWASDGLIAREAYTIRWYEHAVRIGSRYEGQGVAVDSLVRSRLVLDLDHDPDSLYVWPIYGEPPVIHVPPDSVQPRPYPFDWRAGLNLLATLVGRYAPSDSVPRRVRLYPAGEIEIRYQESDSVQSAGTGLRVNRYRVEGFPEGAWYLWLNDGDARPLAGLSLGQELGIAAEGFGRVLLTLGRVAWQAEGNRIVRRLHAAARRFDGPVALAAARVEDGAGGRWEPGVVLMRGDSVIAMGSPADVPLSPDVERIDLGDRYLERGRELYGGCVAPDSLLSALARGQTTVIARPGYFGELAEEMTRDAEWIGPRVLAAATSDTSGLCTGGGRAPGAAFRILRPGVGGGAVELEAVFCRGSLIDVSALGDDR